MTTEVKDQWCDNYQVESSTLNGKQVRELEVSATHVHYGKGYRTLLPPDGKPGIVRIVCIGPVKVVDGKAIILEKPEKQVTDNNTYHDESDSSGVGKPVPKLNKGNYTDQSIVTHKNGNFGTKAGRPKKDVDEKEIMELHKRGWNIRDISRKTGIPKPTVGRLIQGQRVLV